jgi:hypothetical protein
LIHLLHEVLGGTTPVSAPTDWLWLAAWQNAFLFFLDVFVVVLFGLYAWHRMKVRRREVGWRNALLWRSPASDSAVALMCYFSGMAWVRAALWLASYGFISPAASAVVVPIGLALSVWALLCLLRVFGDRPWGPRAWIICVTVALLLASALT